MKISILYITICTLLSSCSSTKWNPHRDTLSKLTHKKILDELEISKNRMPASIQTNLDTELKDLNSISPGKFEIYVFPKISSQHLKEIEEDEILGPPRKIEVSVKAVDSCTNFINQGNFSKYLLQEAFSHSETSPNEYCAIVEMIDTKISNLNKSQIKVDDQLGVRIFLKEYNIVAIDHILYNSRNELKTIRFKSNEEPINSGLSYFPIDLPIEVNRADSQNISELFNRQLDPISLYQIKRRFNKKFEKQNCRGSVYTSKDSFGGYSEIGWCKGIPWPTFINNRRYFSVTQPLKVK